MRFLDKKVQKALEKEKQESCRRLQEEQKHAFDVAMRKVSDLYDEDPAQIKWIIKLYADQIQSMRMTAVFESAEQSDILLDPISESTWEKFIKPDFQRKLLKKSYDLATTPCFTRIWKSSRQTANIMAIGSDVGNPFAEQPLNHFAAYIHPIGAIYVYNGNHSASVGILKGEGRITPVEVYDWTIEYEINDTYFDGISFRSRSGKEPVIRGPKELGYLYEIGRFLYNREEN